MTHADQDICQLDIRQFDIRQVSHLPIRQWPIQTFANLTFANHGKNVLTTMKMFTIVPLLCFMFEIFFISHHVLNIFLFNAMFGKKNPFFLMSCLKKNSFHPLFKIFFFLTPCSKYFCFHATYIFLKYFSFHTENFFFSCHVLKLFLV